MAALCRGGVISLGRADMVLSMTQPVPRYLTMLHRKTLNWCIALLVTWSQRALTAAASPLNPIATALRVPILVDSEVMIRKYVFF